MVIVVPFGLPTLIIASIPSATLAPPLFGVAAAVALHAVLILVDALLKVLLADAGAGVLVAAVAGVEGVVVVHMAGIAGRLVVLVQEEVSAVVEGGRGPALLGVALTAIA